MAEPVIERSGIPEIESDCLGPDVVDKPFKESE
jgi:hypothetical protein